MIAQRRRLSVASLDNEHGPVSRVDSQKSLRSFSSSSSILSIDGLPSLPLVVSVQECLLRRRSPDAVGPGWGFVLRGTTSEFSERTKIYTCHIESVHEDGTAKTAGLREGDQQMAFGPLASRQDLCLLHQCGLVIAMAYPCPFFSQKNATKHPPLVQHIDHFLNEGHGFEDQLQERNFSKQLTVEALKCSGPDGDMDDDDDLIPRSFLKEEIVSVDDVQVKNREHSDVVRMFQSRDKVTLVILPAQFNSCIQARITQTNMIAVNYLWALRHLHSLEIVNVNLSEDRPEAIAEASLVGLMSLRSLSLNHCSLTALDTLKGLGRLRKLESLSLAHNFLSHRALGTDSVLSRLSQLKRLDLSRNLLNRFPDVISSLTNLEVMVLVDNNISELPMMLAKLTKLHTLCLDGNLLREVDKGLSLLPCLQKLTMSNNQLECESQAVKLKEFLVASVNNNPYTRPDKSGLVSRENPSLRRTLSVRGQLFTPKKESRRSVEWDERKLDISDYLATQ